MRTRFLATATALLAFPLATGLALAQTVPATPATPAAPAAPASPPQVEVAPLPEPRAFVARDDEGDLQRDMRELQRQAQEMRRAARDVAREAQREARQAERSGNNDELLELGDRIRAKVDRLVVAQAGPGLPPLPPIPDLGRPTTVRFHSIDKQLSPDDARRIVDGAIAYKGNKRLKVGKAEADGDEWAKVEIRTVDDSLVDTIRVNRKTGAMERTP